MLASRSHSSSLWEGPEVRDSMLIVSIIYYVDDISYEIVILTSSKKNAREEQSIILSFLITDLWR